MGVEKLRYSDVVAVNKQSLEGLLTLDQCKTLLIDRNLAAVSKKTSIRRHDLYKFIKGETDDLRFDHVQALTEYHKSVQVR